MTITQLRTLAPATGFGLAILLTLSGFPTEGPAQGGHVHPGNPAKAATDSAKIAGMADQAMSGAMPAAPPTKK